MELGARVIVGFGRPGLALVLRFALVIVLVLVIVIGPLGAHAAHATETAVEVDGSEATPSVAPAEAAEPDPYATKPGYAQLFFTTFFGDGLRFNNPYRLSTQLGASAESVSRTGAYVDVGAAATFGRPLGLQHGLSLRASVAVEGVGEAVMTPSYLAWRRLGALALWGRAGVPIALTPEPTWGLEAAGGAAWFFLGGFGLAGEVVGDLFYGAGTREVAAAAYPVLSGQLGLVVAYEVLP